MTYRANVITRHIIVTASGMPTQLQKLK